MTTYYIYKDDCLGYTAREAGNGDEGIGSFQGSIDIDIDVTSGWMPGSLGDLDRYLNSLAVEEFFKRKRRGANMKKQSKQQIIWLSNEEREDYEHRVKDAKLDNFLESQFENAEMLDMFLECWNSLELLGFITRGTTLTELKKYALERYMEAWAGKNEIHSIHLSSPEKDQIKEFVSEMFL